MNGEWRGGADGVIALFQVIGERTSYSTADIYLLACHYIMLVFMPAAVALDMPGEAIDVISIPALTMC